ncbi:MAG: hypothetical protein BGN92_10665 [Sphingobacteriales bacterium 41-5]|nr:MAG: hypothetical protein BGN92_10665 [Sphingobacteriales bacterium 41-5]
MTNIQKSPSLLFCIAMDAVGYLSFAVPGVGEVIDVAWAPISAAIFAKTFGGAKGVVGGIFNFVEEALPGMDFIPSFTIMWFMTNKLNIFSKNKTTIIPVKSR